MSKWEDGQAPDYIWLERKEIGAKKYKNGVGTRLMLGKVKCWTINLALDKKEWVCYKLVPGKSKRKI